MTRIWIILITIFGLNLTLPLPGHGGQADADLRAAMAEMGPEYVPRTRHFNPDGSPKYINRLILEASPYLIQHAHNPVDWRPWGEEAFAAARASGKPVFLSVGYSTCYWCHVLERETFEDEDAARFINAHFIPVKVDRERRPDIDEIQSIAMQIRVGVVGHPINSFITPDGGIFAVTGYAPPDVFRERLEIVAGAWAEDRPAVEAEAEKLTSVIRVISAGAGGGAAIDDAALAEATAGIVASADLLTGGFADRQAKFPRAPVLDYLLDRVIRTADPEAEEALTLTLEEITRGGLQDHLGGGFFRYATDPSWEVPHFEKMLYSQAELSRILVKAGIVLGEPRFTRAGRRAADYILREMTAPDGGFYSALDAESEGVEGKYYLWRPGEIAAVLGDDAPQASEGLLIAEGGAFEGASLPRLSSEAWIDPDLLAAYLPPLAAARASRVPPAMDTKIITAWNGMMIASLAEIAGWTGDAAYLTGALRAADRLWDVARRGDDQLWRVRLGDDVSTPGLLADYTHLAAAFIRLYDATGDDKWLDRARQLADYVMASFRDPESGLMRASERLETAGDIAAFPTSDEPYGSGNGMALMMLVKLSHRLDDPSYALQAGHLQAALANRAIEDPLFHAASLKAMAANLYGEADFAAAGAGGRLRAEILTRSDGGLEIALSVAPGWHINAREPLQDYLIPTRLETREGAEPTEVRYPEPVVRTLGFQPEPLALLEGSLRITIPGESDTEPDPLRLHFQACSDEICLTPEQIVLVPR